MIENPISMLELAAQSVSDTVETEGIAYLTGNALTVLIPASFGIKVVKGGAGLKGPGKAKVKEGKGSEISKETAHAFDQIDGIKIVNGKVDDKVPVEDFKKIRADSVHNVDSDSLTLGKYTPTIEDGVPNWGLAGPDSYIAKAGKDSTYFDLGDDWSKIQKKYNLTDDDMFDLFNKPVLDDAVAGGKEIRFSHDPRIDEYKTSYLRKEWEYLQEKYGYKTLKKKGEVLIAK
ncbi:hypothetical protein SPD48_04730 [Pseudogracilibacillus sp. SE30717A]|uniref:hypothetical protein n=1 Tax=Pseudogracilibacillus sp. SE30717A TaxID=3098293 RepID=UPI00300DCD95